MKSTTIARPATKAVSATKLGALASLSLGIGIIFFIGFSHIEVVHNAAHDTRHSSAFPCH